MTDHTSELTAAHAPRSDAPSPAQDSAALRNTAAAAAAAALLAACGGGDSSTSTTASGGTLAEPRMLAASAPAWQSGIGCTEAEASRFLAQASMGATRALIQRVRSIGFEAWIDEQVAMPQSASRLSTLLTLPTAASPNADYFDNVMWSKLIASPDTLRQRVTLALSEILVVSVNTGLIGNNRWDAARFADLLETNAFGNYRTVLELASTSAAMGIFLSFINNQKGDPLTGRQPDENYARELLQLFTIGLNKLQMNGQEVMDSATGKAVPNYTQDDVSALARVFTGWRRYNPALGPYQIDRLQPLVQDAALHEPGASTFMGQTIAAHAASGGVAVMQQALNIIYANASVAPFISKQLIKRLVTSNPSADYVARVATIFQNDGTGAKGNLKAVVKAILLDTEARDSSRLGNVAYNTTMGKLREPILRFTAWARAYGVTSSDGRWSLIQGQTFSDTSAPHTSLGQGMMRALSVFNFFRPDYRPSTASFANLSAPEFQIVNETSVVGYLNFMQTLVGMGNTTVRPNYSSLTPLMADTTALLNEVNVVLCAGQLSAATLATIKAAIDKIAATSVSRVYAAVFLSLASPEFLVLK